MKFYRPLIVFVCLSLVTTAFGQADDDDDDGIVEDVPDEKVVQKKQYEKPTLSGKPHLMESFDNQQDYKKRWTQSQAKKDDADEDIAKYDGKWSLEEPKDSALEGDLALVLKSKAKHHAISSKLAKPFEFTGKPFIVSYEVRFQNGMDCGGAYIKLLSKTDKLNLKSFHDKTPYTIMFGPDKCGLDHKLHFIFRHKNPKTGEYEEKHAKKPSGKIDSYFTDKKTHLYTLVVNSDNTFEVLIDNKVISSGSLLEDVSPPVNPPKEIDDPNDKKPEDWDEREKIPDPDASKPDDWDEDAPREIPDEEAVKPDGWLDEEEALIPDPDSEKPSDWDDEMDGEWEAPLIDNPACKDAPGCGEWKRPMMPNPEYKGKWKPPMIDNPNYQGEWSPRRIPNPDWFEDKEPYKMTTVDALGLELWSMTDEIVFDNFIITDDRELHSSWLEQTFEKKSNAEYYSGGQSALVQGILDVTRDRPWLWAVILVVIVLPIVLIIAYCCISKNEQGIWRTLIDAADQRPWLYAVYIVVLLLPVVLLSICLCPRSGPIKPEDIERKKTDEPSPDDEQVEGEEAGEDNNKETSEVGPDGDSPVKTRKSKAALEKEEEVDDQAEEEKEEEEEEEENEDQDNDDNEEDTPDDKSSSPKRTSPRKRKPRKD